MLYLYYYIGLSVCITMANLYTVVKDYRGLDNYIEYLRRVSDSFSKTVSSFTNKEILCLFLLFWLTVSPVMLVYWVIRNWWRSYG